MLGHPTHVGPVGAGSAAKLVANTTLVGLIGLLGESLVLGEGLGLPSDVVFDVLATTALAQQAERRRAVVESGDYPPRFALSLARKDAELIVEAAADARVDLRLVPAARTCSPKRRPRGWAAPTTQPSWPRSCLQRADPATTPFA